MDHRRGRRARLLSGATVAAAIAVMNVTTYGLTLVAARMLGPAQFGQFSAILGVLLVVNVLSLGLQATGARRISTHPDSIAEVERDIRRTATRCALAMMLLGLLTSPLLARLLDLDSALSTALMALAAGLLAVMGGLSGLLQGEERWGPLSGVYMSMGIARLLFGVGALLIHRSTTSAMAGVALAALVPALIAHLALGRDHARHTSAPVGAEPRRSWLRWEEGSVLREVAHSTQALLAFFALSNADIVLARVLLSDHGGGLYAAGLIVTKAVLFLPQFVVIVAFPAMARRAGGSRTHLLGLAVVLAVGLLATGGVALLPGLALEFAGGAQYAAVSSLLWLFAALGTVLAMVQVLVYSALAAEHGRAIWVLWAAIPVLVGAALLVPGITELTLVKLCVDTSVLAVLVVILRRSGPSEPTTEPLTPSLREDPSSPEQPAVR